MTVAAHPETELRPMRDCVIVVTPRSFGQHDEGLRRELEAAVGEVHYRPGPLTAAELAPIVADADGLLAGLDEITHAVVEALHTTFITPIDRNDIHRLITKMDDIMDMVEAAADRLALYDLPKMTPEAGDLARCLVSSAEHVLSAVSGIRDLGKPNGILQHCIEINRLENVADSILRGALVRLFREEKDPIAIIKWKEIYETLESATDRCEDVANIIEGVVLENS